MLRARMRHLPLMRPGIFPLIFGVGIAMITVIASNFANVQRITVHMYLLKFGHIHLIRREVINLNQEGYRVQRATGCTLLAREFVGLSPELCVVVAEETILPTSVGIRKRDRGQEVQLTLNRPKISFMINRPKDRNKVTMCIRIHRHGILHPPVTRHRNRRAKVRNRVTLAPIITWECIRFHLLHLGGRFIHPRKLLKMHGMGLCLSVVLKPRKSYHKTPILQVTKV